MAGGPVANPSTPLPAAAMPRYGGPIQQTPAPTMPTMQPMPRPMLQTPAPADQVRQQLMTALTPRPQFNI